MHRRFCAALVGAILLASINVGFGQAASSLWIAPLLDNTGVEVRLALGPAGVHHITVTNDLATGGTYMTDRGNRWTYTSVNGRPEGLNLDSAGHVFILGRVTNPANQNDPRLSIQSDEVGPLASDVVPGSAYAQASAMAVADDGTVHVAWTTGDDSVSYATRTAGIWSSIQTVSSLIPSAHTMALALDGNGTAHILMSGTFTFGHDGPTGCGMAASTSCVVDVAMSDPAVVTTAATYAGPYSIDAITGPDGTIEAVYGTDSSLEHLSNAGNIWTKDTVATGNILSGSIRNGPNGLVAIFGFGTNDGIHRADLVGSTWNETDLNVGPVGPEAYGVVDANDEPHVAFTFSWNHPNDGGYVPTAYILAPDAIGPTVGTPVARPTVGKKVGSTITTTIAWSAVDALSGPDHFQLQQSSSGGSFITASSSLTTRSMARSLVSGRSYAFRVRGTDAAGNTGAYATGPTIKVTASQQTSTALHYGGTWHTSTSTAYFGGSTRYASSSSASASITTSMRGFAWISTYGPTRGSAKIYVDGVWITTVNLHRTTSTYRVVAWSIAWSASGTHKVMIKPVGTAGHPRIDLDGFILVR